MPSNRSGSPTSATSPELTFEISIRNRQIFEKKVGFNCTHISLDHGFSENRVLIRISTRVPQDSRSENFCQIFSAHFNGFTFCDTIRRQNKRFLNYRMKMYWTFKSEEKTE